MEVAEEEQAVAQEKHAQLGHDDWLEVLLVQKDYEHCSNDKAQK